ncbi:unnamed protein product [Clonostachys byssicola]|uniref:Cytochrome P450 n=1 Tax=Clonostachys byssicola TaxID=160290 RepID=A0A9N9XZJ7_9HYPO|nr:unnamed protein product [Clonostachys byssicola]
MVLPAGLTQYVVTGPRNIAKVFRAEGMHATLSHVIAMERSFGISPRGLALYAADDSGFGAQPQPQSKVDPENRVLYQIHNLVNQNLAGSSLSVITEKFQEFLATELSSIEAIGPDWTDVPDLGEFLQVHVMSAALKAMFGTYILSLNPTFIDDFWAWNPEMGTLFMGLPKWLAPSIYEKRERVLQNIMRWHDYAHAHFDCHKVADEDPAWEPYFGSKFSRKRQALFSRWEAMDKRSRAAEDMSFIWASNANSVGGSIWFLLELLLDPALQDRMMNEFRSAMVHPKSSTSVPTFNVDRLTSGALCQSVYAETLRLRVAIMIGRKAKYDMDFSGWFVKENETVAISNTIEAMDTSIWNTGTEGDPHPLETFWADRFLIYPGDKTSGPVKRQLASENSSKETETIEIERNDPAPSPAPQFSVKGVGNSWVPFSGGPRHCPGRHFAKQEMILVAAMVMSAFEIELKVEPGWRPKNDTKYFGFGTMPPSGIIPCRIRRRTQIGV